MQFSCRINIARRIFAATAVTASPYAKTAAAAAAATLEESESESESESDVDVDVDADVVVVLVVSRAANVAIRTRLIPTTTANNL